MPSSILPASICCSSSRVTSSDPAADQEYSWQLRLHKAAFEGNWRIAEPIIQEHQEAAFTAQITRAKETVLHVAVGRDRASRFLEKLVSEMKKRPKLLEQKDGNGKTALDTAAKVGNIKAARILVKGNPNLPNISNNQVRPASLCGQVWSSRNG